MLTGLRTLSGRLSARRHKPPCLAAMSQTADQRLHQKMREAELILGSSSSSRRQIMDELAREVGFTYSTASADIDEQAIRDPDPERLVSALARAKAAAIRARLKPSDAHRVLITCDQVVVCGDSILEKPADAEQARRFIEGYAHEPATTVGSVLCTDLQTGRTAEGIDRCEIGFERIPDASVDQLIAEGSVFFCAGGLMVEHPLVQPCITYINGDIDGVMGLSKRLLLQLLSELLQPANMLESGADEA